MISINESLGLQLPEPLDIRTQIDDIDPDTLYNVPNPYVGLIMYNTDDKKYYKVISIMNVGLITHIDSIEELKFNGSVYWEE